MIVLTGDKGYVITQEIYYAISFLQCRYKFSNPERVSPQDPN